MKKLLAILAATAVLASATLVTTSTLAMTADAVCTVTITNDVDGSAVTQSYEFYQIFGGTVTGSSVSGNGQTGEMEDIVWGEAIGENGSDFILALQSAFTDDEFKDCTNAAAVAEAIKNNFTSTGDIDKLAAAIADYVTDNSVAFTTTTTTTTTEDVTKVTADITSSGYYLIVDKSTSRKSGLGDDEKDEYDISKHMLAVINASETTMDIATKKEKPSLVKKVCENSVTNSSDELSYHGDTGYNDIADYCIGDEVPFKLYATLPSTFDGFDSYYLCFHDQLGSEFDFDDTSVKVTLRVGGNDYTIGSIDGSTGSTNDSIDGSTGSTNYTVSTSTSDVCTFEVAFDNILNISLDATSYASWEAVAGAGAEIIVSYNATLNDIAVIGLSGQENEACLEYSNDVNNEASGESHEDNTGFTPWDKVIVFTYELDINKVSSADDSLLAGAQFTLQNSNDEYAVLDGDTLTDWTTDSDQATTITTTGATVVIKGLDDGTYTLTETKAPSGYNNDPQNIWELTIASDHDSTTGDQNGQQDWSGTASDALVSLTLTGDDSGSTVTGVVDTGIVTATIKNTSGAALPTTGGIGTTIFYVAGGVLVVGAGVLLISRKRSRS